MNGSEKWPDTTQMSSELMEDERGIICSPEGTYYSASRLAELKIPGLPKTRAGIYKTAAREGWPQINRPGKGAKEGVKFFLVPKKVIDKINEKTPIKAAEKVSTVHADSSGARAHYGRRADDFRHAPLEQFIKVPRYDIHASAGAGPAIHSEQIVDHWAFKPEWVQHNLGVAPRDLALISVKGDSMVPTLSSGDMVLIDTHSGRVENDAVYVLQHEGDLRVKRIQRKMDGTLVVMSDNKQYSDEVLSPPNAALLNVVGRVVWAGRRM